MKILIVDRDRLAASALQHRLEEAGHEVAVELVRKTALERINEETFDVIAIDPAPLPSVKQFTLPLRWEQRDDYFYMILLGHDFDDTEVIKSGMNDRIDKAIETSDLVGKLENAARLTGFMNRLSHSNEIASDNRLFGQRAFYQLVLSALDRAYRYGEQAYLLVINIVDGQALADKLGHEQAGAMIADLGLYLSSLHRMSDYLGRTDEAEFVLLLLRPAADSEPQDAADRFQMALADYQAQLPAGISLVFNLELWALPSADVKVRAELKT